MKILFLGGGNMANALIGGMVKQDFAAADIHVIDPGADARSRLSASYGVHCHAAAGDAPDRPDVLVLAVKPQQMREAVAPLVGRLGQAIVVSIAAGLDMSALSRWLGGHRQIVRCMPNTPALIGAGITGLCALPDVDAAGKALAERVLRAVGSTVWIDNEAQMDAVTAISGSGPAYVFYFIEALEQAGIDLGLAPETARQLTLQTFLGAASLAGADATPPAELRARVTSKGGTTEQGILALERADVKAAIRQAAQAAAARAVAMGDALGSQQAAPAREA